MITSVPAATAATTPPDPPGRLNPIPLREFANGSNFLYTGYYPEAANAQSYGFTVSTRRQVGYVFASGGAGTHPLYRLRQSATGRYVLATYQPEIDWMKANGFVLEGAVGALYDSPVYGAQEIRRYRNAGGWRLAYASQDAEMTKAGYTVDGPLGYMVPSYYKVGAYYFGTWDQNTSPLFLDAAEQFYGRRDPWAGVRDFHDGATQGFPGDWSYLKPKIGYYDDSQVSVLQQQIDQAADAGLSYFSFYDYWNNQTGATQIDTGLNTFLQAPNRDRLDFMISIVLPPSDTDPEHLKLPKSQFDAAVNAFAARTTEPNYLTTQDGRPLIFLEDTRGIGDGSVADQNAFTALLRTKVQQLTGVAPFILVHSEYGLDTVKQLDGDGMSCLAIGSAIQSGSYAQYIAGAPNYFSAFDATGKPMMRCAMAGFDETPRAGFWIPANQIRRFTDDSKAQFPQALAVTRTSADGAPMSPIDNYVTLYAWNEWTEGGIVEPNERDGSYYLDAVTKAFGLTSH